MAKTPTKKPSLEEKVSRRDMLTDINGELHPNWAAIPDRNAALVGPDEEDGYVYARIRLELKVRHKKGEPWGNMEVAKNRLAGTLSKERCGKIIEQVRLAMEEIPGCVPAKEEDE